MIQERKSEDIKSSNASECVSEEQIQNQNMNNLYLPNNHSEATRKRVISFKKIGSNEASNSKKTYEHDEYLEFSDDEMNEDINVSIQTLIILELRVKTKIP